MKVAKDYVGGSLELDLSWLAKPPSQRLETYFGLDANALLAASGRSAFGAILDHLKPEKRVVLVPDFLCGDVMLPRLRERDITYRFFPVRPNLTIDEDALLACVDENPAAVLLVNYFGLSEWRLLAGKIRARNDDVPLILDNVQALYDRSGQAWADYTFTSFRKFLSVPDGAFVWASKPFGGEWNSAPSIDSGAPYIAAAVLRHGFLEGSFSNDQEDKVEETYLELFKEASTRIPTTAAAMSAFSQALVERLPLDTFARQRRENYRYLAGVLAAISELTVIRSELPNDSVSLALPVLAPKDRRNDMIAYLRDRNIFCSVHWPLTGDQRQNGGTGCKELADRIVSFPIDQRYDPERLERVATAVTEYWHQA